MLRLPVSSSGSTSARIAAGRGCLYQHAADWVDLAAVPAAHPPARLAGDDDPIIPLANAVLAALIPSARLHVYNSGHLER